MNKAKRARWCNPVEEVGTEEGEYDYARRGGAAPLVYI